MKSRCESIIEKFESLNESLKYKKVGETENSYGLESGTPHGDAILSVATGDRDVVYLVEVGDKTIFDAMDNEDSLNWDNGAISIESAKKMVDLFLKGRKFNAEKWLKSSKFISDYLEKLNSGRYKLTFNSSKTLTGKVIGSLIMMIDEGNAIDGVIPWGYSNLLDFLRTNKAVKILYSKLDRLLSKNPQSNKLFRSDKERSLGNDDKSFDSITNKAIDKLLAKKGLMPEPTGDWFEDMFNSVPLSGDMLAKVKKARGK